MGICNAKILRQRCIRESVRHGQFAGFRRDNAARDRRHNEIALARSLAIDQLIETLPPYGGEHGLHMPMR